MRNHFSMLFKAFKHKDILFSYCAKMGLLNFLDDETYLKMKYRLAMGQPLNLDHPLHALGGSLHHSMSQQKVLKTNHPHHAAVLPLL